MVELSWALRRPSSPSPTARLVCVPYAGATSAVFRAWSNSLPTAALGFAELPNRDPRRRFDTDATLTGAAAALAELIKSTPDGPPCILFGHSLGALVAFEAARRLTDWPALAGLVVSGRRPPTIEDDLPPISHLPGADFLAAIQQRYAAIPPEITQEPELLALLLPRLRADMVMVESYRYEPGARLSCPLFVYGGEADSHTPPPKLPHWAEQTTGRCEVRLFEGGHFFFLNGSRAALLDILAGDLSTCAREAARPLGCG